MFVTKDEWKKTLKDLECRDRKLCNKWYDRMSELWLNGKAATAAYRHAKQKFYYYSARMEGK